MSGYINDEIVVNEMIDRFQNNLPITWDGTKYNETNAWNVLIAAATTGKSISVICRESKDGPSDNTLREQLDVQKWSDKQIEEACNEIFAKSCVGCKWRGSYEVAIDLHEEPFYGKPPEDDSDIIRRGEAKAGTTWFHVFATAYVIRKNRRFTLAATRVRAGDRMLEVANRLKERVEKLGIKVSAYLMDRQFWCAALLWAWKEVPYIIPMRRTGKKESGGGTRPLFEEQESQFTSYSMSHDEYGNFETEVAIVVLPETKEARKKRLLKAKEANDEALKNLAEKTILCEKNPTSGTKCSLTWAKKAQKKTQEKLELEELAEPTVTLCYAINKVKGWSIGRIYHCYRSRFGIESSYRQGRQARFHTSSRKPWFRFLRFGIAHAIRNLWIEIRWFLAEPKQGRGGRKISKKRFTFPSFTLWLAIALCKLMRFEPDILPLAGLPNPLWKKT